MLGEFVQVVNACLHLCRESLDMAIFERFVGDVILRQHHGVQLHRSGGNMRCLGWYTLWTLLLAFLGCHGTISLWTHDVSRGMACLYNTTWHSPCHRDWRGVACTSCPGVSSMYDGYAPACPGTSMETMACPIEAMTWAPWTGQRRARVRERTVPHGIQTQQKSQETAESPPASTAATPQHTPSCDPDTPRERQPSCHDHDRRNPAADS